MVFNATFNNIPVFDLQLSAISAYNGEMYLIQHYVIKFVNDLQEVSGFLRGLWFPPPIKLPAMI
jgi:hypothetical protein